MSRTHGIWYELNHTEENCNRYWGLWQSTGWEKYLENYHWCMGRRRTLLRWLLEEQLKEFDYD